MSEVAEWDEKDGIWVTLWPDELMPGDMQGRRMLQEYGRRP